MIVNIKIASPQQQECENIERVSGEEGGFRNGKVVLSQETGIFMTTEKGLFCTLFDKIFQQFPNTYKANEISHNVSGLFRRVTRPEQLLIAVPVTQGKPLIEFLVKESLISAENQQKFTQIIDEALREEQELIAGRNSQKPAINLSP